MPVVAVAGEDDAVVEAIGTALPEFDAIRLDAVAAPRMRARDFLVFEALVEMVSAFLKHRALFDRLALLRRPGAQLMAARTRRKVCIGIFIVQRRRATFDTDLSFELIPVERDRYLTVEGDFMTLLTAVRRIELQTARVDTAQQDHP